MFRLLASGFCLLAFSAVEGAEEYFPFHGEFETALRGQSPDETVVTPPLSIPAPTPHSTAYPAAVPQDPFLSPGIPYQPGPPPPLPQYGRTGAQPYRIGWTPRFDMAYLPSSDTQPDFGNFSAYESDSELVYNTLVTPDLVFTASPQFGFREWDLSDNFSRDFYRFGLNLQMASPATTSLGYQVGFNPSINTDFEHNLTSDAYNFDANAMIFYRLDPAWMFVLGAGYLDRVRDIVIPYAGVVYTPDDFWEFRLLFPQGRISRYIGDFWWGSHWLYLAWEYHVESYQVSFDATPREQVQMEDYRLTVGLRSDHPGFSKYIEAGWVFGRDIDFKYATPGFDISDGFIVRGGIRF